MQYKVDTFNKYIIVPCSTYCNRDLTYIIVCFIKMVINHVMVGLILEKKFEILKVVSVGTYTCSELYLDMDE